MDCYGLANLQVQRCLVEVHMATTVNLLLLKGFANSASSSGLTESHKFTKHLST